ncbi:hypothetical protein NEOLEDRAFT_756707 [Neolentinus lepideus HHB14362 ss-1]|uniref:F-box domain-containing protein n=1 Tax=Neolentinus lepideus HHB14362 ss-1 TaxID=1314782 RepID=A0A165PR26_9AGAM|nr:hypothetical protein NEOLEDRAFT_756707 [Neolentinus lepideus HHB14362 ss-1]
MKMQTVTGWTTSWPTSGLSKISTLPNELLVEIFRFSAFSQPITNIRQLRGKKSWLSLTHVCSHWRDISLEDHCLWSNVVLDIGSLAWGKEFLARARGGMVDVTIRGTNAPHSPRVLVPTLDLLETAKIISSHLTQIRSLNVCLSRGYDINYLLESFISDTSPLALMNLLVEVSHDAPPDHLVTLPAAIRNATPLRNLQINCLFFDWTSMVFTGLVHLSLQRQDRLCAPSMETFLQVLRSCPCLETLSLLDAGPLYETEHTVHEPVRLPRLRQLTMKNWSADLKYVLEYLVFPPSTKVALTYTGSGEKYSDMLDIFPSSCASLIDKASRARRTDIRLLGTDHVTGRLEIHCDDDISTINSHPGLSIAICSMYAACLVEPLVSFFSRHTEHLAVHQPSSSSPRWLNHLQKYSALTTLATDVDPERLVSVLEQTDEETKLICPKLTMVTFTGKYFALSQVGAQRILGCVEGRGGCSGTFTYLSTHKEVLFHCAYPLSRLKHL